MPETFEHQMSRQRDEYFDALTKISIDPTNARLIADEALKEARERAGIPDRFETEKACAHVWLEAEHGRGYTCLSCRAFSSFGPTE